MGEFAQSYGEQQFLPLSVAVVAAESGLAHEPLSVGYSGLSQAGHCDLCVTGLTLTKCPTHKVLLASSPGFVLAQVLGAQYRFWCSFWTGDERFHTAAAFPSRTLPH